jgi:hypothetical protein
MSIIPLTVPQKTLTQSISSSATSFKVNNIKSWAKDSLGRNIDLVAGDFGSQAFCVFRNATGTTIEIMEFDPSTIASASITILKRGLKFNGDPTTETTAYKLDWPAGSIVQFGTDVPQLMWALSSNIKNNTVASSATPTINTNNTEFFTITALATNITSFTTNLSGTPSDGQKLIIRIIDDGTPRTIAWGASFASRGGTLPVTTSASVFLYVGLIWNSTTSTWDCVGTSE